MDNYNSLKKETYSYLLNDSDEVRKLIISMITILYYHDKCIEKDNKHNYKLNVTKSFIKQCNASIIFTKNDNQVYKLNEIDRFNTIRNKIAHGDFTIDEEKQCFIFIIRPNEVTTNIKDEIETEVPMKSIISFSKKLPFYYRFLSSKKERKTIYITEGKEYEFIDKPKKKLQRNNTYESYFYLVAENIVKPKSVAHYAMAKKSLRNTTAFNPSFFDIKYTERETEKEDDIIILPEAKDFEMNLITQLYKADFTSMYDSFVNNLIDFYRYYIYPLENFLKEEDKTIQSLQNDHNFGFESLSIEDSTITDESNLVGKVKNYKKEIKRIESRLNKLYENMVREENIKEMKKTKEEKEKLQERINSIKENINSLLDLLNNVSVQKMYDYGQNRSLIEHIRCSITHGTFDYKLKSDEISFTDEWQGQKEELIIKNKDFENLFSYDNKEKIRNQYEKVYQRKLY